MDKEPALNAAAFVDPIALVEFLDALRRAGFPIGGSQYIAAQDLIVTLTARGEPLGDGDRLERYLRPLLCSSAREQADFPSHFATWRGRLLPDGRPAEESRADLRPYSEVTHVAERIHDAGTSARALKRMAAVVFLTGLAVSTFVLWNVSRQQWNIHLVTDPPGAHVRLSYANDADTTMAVTDPLQRRGPPAGPDGDSLFITPLRWIDIPAGSYDLLVTRAGYADTVQTIDVGGSGTEIEIMLALRALERARASFSTIPEEATITLDPANIALRDSVRSDETRRNWSAIEGDYTVRVTSPGFHDVTERISLSPDSIRVRRFELRPRPLGNVSVRTEPGGAEVSIDGIAVAVTPADSPGVRRVIAGVDTGSHVVHATLDGYEPAESAIDVAANATAPIELRLVRISTRSLRISSDPDSARVWIDGEFVGTTDGQQFAVDVGLGPHRIRIAKIEYDDFVADAFRIDSTDSFAVRLRTTRRSLRRLAYGPNRQLAAGYTDSTVVIWDADRHVPLREIRGDTLRMSRRGRDGPAIEWAPRRGSENAEDDESAAHAWLQRLVQDVALAPDGSRAVAPGNADSVQIHSAASETPVGSLVANGVPIRSLAFSPDGRLLAHGDRDGGVWLWVASPVHLRAWPVPTPRSAQPIGLHFSDDGDTLLARGSERTVAWNVNTGASVAERRGLPQSASEATEPSGAGADVPGETIVSADAIGSNGTMEATSGDDGVIRLWQREGASRVIGSDRILAQLPGPVQSLAFSTDETLLAAADADSVRIWAVSPMRVVTGEAGAIVDAARFNSTETRLARGTGEGSRYLWRIALGHHNASVTSLAFSPDGSRLASASLDSTAIVWDVRANAPMDTLRPGDRVESVAFSLDGRRLATAQADTIAIWNTGGSRTATIDGWLRRRGWVLAPGVVLGGLALIMVPVGWRRRAKQFLARRRTTEPPDIMNVTFAGLESPLFSEVSLFRLVQQFRRRVEIDAPDLAVPETVRATVDRAGVFSPVFARRQIPPEYIALIDRATYGDQQSQYIDELLDRLVRDGVFVVRYYFDGDPRVCFPQAAVERPASLRRLTHRFPEHKLLLFANASALFNPVTGEREAWTHDLLDWPERAVVTPEIRERWGVRERSLADDFVVRHASPSGLLAMGTDEPVEDTEELRPIAPFPPSLWRNGERWLERDPVSVAELDSTIADLHAFLGEAGFFWLAACAVPPAMNWRLTINLGYALLDEAGQRLLDGERLLALSRLPWFRHGYMPDWIRERLIDEMTPAQDAHVRRAFWALLATATEGRGDVNDLRIARDEPKALNAIMSRVLNLLQKEAPDEHLLNDYLFVSFMKEETAGKLVVRVGRAVTDIFESRRSGRTARRREADVKRVQSVVAAVLPFLVMLAIGASAVWNEIPATHAGVHIPQVASIAVSTPVREQPPQPPASPNTGLIIFLIVAAVMAVGVQAMRRIRLSAAAGSEPAVADEQTSSESRARTRSHVPAILTRLKGRSTAAVGAAVVLAALALVTMSGIGNYKVQTRTDQLLRNIRTTRADGVSSIQALDAFRAHAEMLDSFARQGLPLRLRFWPSTGLRGLGFFPPRADDTYPEVGLEYSAALMQLLGARPGTGDNPLIDPIRTYLAGLGDAPSPDVTYERAYDALKAYLILTVETQRATPEFLAPALLSFLPDTAGEEVGYGDLLRRQLEFYAIMLAYGLQLHEVEAADAGLVERVRQFLASFSDSERVYARLLAVASVPSIQWTDAVVVNPTEVPGAFTAGGWATVQSALDQMSFGSAEPWVLGDSTSANPQTTIDPQQQSAIRARYTSDYIATWSRFLEAASIVRFTSSADAARKLQQLSTNASPLVGMLRILSTNTAVDSLIAAAFQPIHAVVPPGSTTLSDAAVRYLTGLTRLATSMEALSAPPTELVMVTNEAANAGRQLSIEIAAISRAFSITPASMRVGQTLTALLQMPANHTQRIVGDVPARNLNGLAAAFCASFGAVARKYPLDRRATQDATIEEVSVLFRPGTGLVAQLDDPAGLGRFVVRQGSRYVAASTGSVTLSEVFLRYLNWIVSVSNTLYAGDGEGPRLNLSVRPELPGNVERVIISWDASRSDFTRTNNTSQLMPWAGRNAPASIDVTAAGTSRAVTAAASPWALFRLLDQATDIKDVNGRWSGTFTAPGAGSVIVEIATAGSVSLSAWRAPLACPTPAVR